MKIVRVIARIALILLVLALCAIIVYGLWRFVRAYWPAILFYGYVVPVALYVIVGVFAVLRKGAPGMSARDRALQVIGAAADDASTFTRVRRFVGGALDALGMVVSWPVDFFRTVRSGRPAAGVLNNMANASLHNPQFKRAAFLLVLVGVVTLVSQRAPSSAVYGRRFLYIVVIAMICKHLAYSFGGVSLPQSLRRSKGNPYLRYVGVLVVDFATYVIAFSTLVPAGPAEPLPRLLYIARQIFGFNSVGDVLQSGVITRQTFLIAIAGITWYIGLLQSAIKLQDFRRVDDDYQALANAHILLGEYVQGLKLLSQIRVANSNTHSLNVAAYIGVGQFEKARESARIVVQLGKQRSPTDEEIHLVMLGMASVYAIPEPLLLTVLKRALDSGIADLRLHSVLSAIATVSTAGAGELYEELSRHGIDKFPLSAAFLLIGMERGEEAFNLINGLTLQDDMAEFVRRYLLLAAQFSSDFTTGAEDVQAFEAWAEEELPKVEELIKSREESEKIAVLAVVEQLKVFAQQALPHRQQQLEYVAAEARRKLQASSSSETLRAMKSLDRLVRSAST